MSTLVTDTPGSGKTTLVAYAEKQNDKRFVDANEAPGLCEWQNYLLKEAQRFSPIIVTGNDIATTYQKVTDLVSE